MKSHIPPDQISAWADGQIEAGAGEKIERHLQSCQSCRALGDDMKAEAKLFRSLEVLTPPASMWYGISGRLTEQQPPLRPWCSWMPVPATSRWFYAEVLALAATLVFGCGIAIHYWSTVHIEQRQLAEIERTYHEILPHDVASLNPFASSSWNRTGKNPFTFGDGGSVSDLSRTIGKR